MLIGTFMVQNRDTQTQFLLGDSTNTLTAVQAAGEYGNDDKTFRQALLASETICFNQSNS